MRNKTHQGMRLWENDQCGNRELPQHRSRVRVHHWFTDSDKNPVIPQRDLNVTPDLRWMPNLECCPHLLITNTMMSRKVQTNTARPTATDTCKHKHVSSTMKEEAVNCRLEPVPRQVLTPSSRLSSFSVTSLVDWLVGAVEINRVWMWIRQYKRFQYNRVEWGIRF